MPRDALDTERPSPDVSIQLVPGPSPETHEALGDGGTLPARVSPRRRPSLPTALPLVALLAACGGQGSSDTTPIPSTGVPVAAAGARGVDVTTTTPPPVDPMLAPTSTAPPGMPTMPPHDPFAPPVSPPPVPPAPTGTGVPL